MNTKDAFQSQNGPPELVVAIGGSAGSYVEIEKIVKSLSVFFNGTVVIAMHRIPKQENTLIESLGNRAKVKVLEPQDEEDLECTTIYVGSSMDRVGVDDVEFEVREDTSARARMRRIDDLFESVADSAGKHAVGVILSGTLTDGVKGLRAIHEAGGTCLVQHPAQARHDSMPQKALDAVPSARVGTTEEIESWLMELSADYA